jgi:protoporphyrinogen/coproporphyrinogen III oxidase
MKVAVVGGGIAGLAATRRLESLLPEAEIVLVEGSERLGGKLLTERVDGFVLEGAADSFLSRKERGVGLCEELGLADELIGRRPENARSFVRRAGELYPLPEGLTGMIPTNLDALAESPLLSAEGRARLAAEVDLPPAARDADESIATFVSRRLGREAYENLVEPLMTGIYGGDGDQLSLEATFPNLRALELEHGSVIRGLAAQPPAEGAYPPFVSLRGGTDTLVTRLVESLDRPQLETGARAAAVRSRGVNAGYAVEVEERATVDADALVLAVPAFVAAKLLAGLDEELAETHAQIPYASSAIVTLGYRNEDVPRPLDGYGYVVPRVESADVLACTWTSSKWDARAPDGYALLRVYLGRFGRRDVTRLADEELVALAREELRILEIEAVPYRTWIHRWPRGMPQYVLGHTERLERIDEALERHPGLALAGAAYRGVGIPDCIRSGEEAAQAIARSLAGVESHVSG